MDVLTLFWVGLIATVLAACATASTAAPATERGRSIFLGREPPTGTVRGHLTALPTEVARCNNCHGALNEKAPAGTYAAPLGRAWLLEPRERRGGPPTSYELASFCKVLRTGIDPASILVSRVMPTYRIDEAQCASLWTFLTDPAK